MFEYDYKCFSCGEEFLISLKHMKENTDEIFCPICLSTKTKRIFKPIAVHYNVGGFYSKEHTHLEV